MMELKESPKYVLSFDESLNKKLQKGQMDILIRYWDSDKNIAEFMAQSLWVVLKQSRYSTRITCVEGITCGLHTVHRSLKSGIKCSNWNVGKILKAMSKLLEDCPARREWYEIQTESNLYPLPYCGHRWCGNENCASWAEKLWPGFVKFVNYLTGFPESKQPQGKSFSILQEAVKDLLIPAKLKFVEFLASKLNRFLQGFQMNQPMVPYLNNVLKEVLNSFMNMFISSGK